MGKTNEQMNYEEFMIQYQDYYEEYMDVNEQYESFYAYGPLTEKYWTYNPRILVCNLEPYDKREGVVKVDIDLYKEWIKVNTGKNTARFITGLTKVLILENLNETIRFDNSNIQELLRNMENAAYMNFRISSGEKVKADNKGILRDVRTHSNYLIAQINSLCPDIIIIGGVEGCSNFNFLFNCDLKFNTTKIYNGKVICSINHFRQSNYKYYNEKVNEILACLKSI